MDIHFNGYKVKYVKLNSYGEEELNMNCLLESCSFREGIIEGCCANFNTNFIYANKSLAPQIECLLTSLGLISTIETFDTIGNKNTNTACRIEWYKSQCENEEYCKIDSIEKYDYDDEYVYCFEMENKNEPYFTLPNGIISHNCRLRNEMQDNTFSYTLGAGGVSTGSKAVITMNINRIVQNVYRNKDVPTNEDISNAISQQAEDIHKYLIAYNEIIKEKCRK